MTTAQPSSQTACAAAPSVAQVEASCRLPVLFLAFSGVAWLLAGAALALLASIQLYQPTFMEGCAWVTYGRLRPAAVNALTYGFALQTAFALALWLIARLGRVELVAPLGLTIAAKFWNIAVTVGVFGILAGDATGFDLLEFPLYAALPLFASYACIAAWALVALHRRTERELYVSLWFVLAALLWFPWILSTAQGLLLGWQVPGVVQAIVAGWFANNLLQIVLTSFTLAVLFYFVPKAVNRPLANPGLARAGFWLLLLIGGWGGLSQLAAVPAWIPSVSGAANVLVIVPVLALLVSLWQTADGKIAEAWTGNVPFRFLLVAAILLLGVTLRSALFGGHWTQFTFFAAARTDIVLLGVFGLAALGALHYIVPRLTTGEEELPSEWLADLAFWAAFMGVLAVGAGFSFAGLKQAAVGASANDKFLEVAVTGIASNLKLVTVGYGALAVAALAFLVNFGLAARRCCLACCGGAR
ncbi:MAG: cbb3-type cytochrome c oxidase subunit I [Limisphaerales bacterium]